METVREVFEKYGENAYQARRINETEYNLSTLKHIIAIPVEKIVDGIENGDSDSLIDLQDFGVCSCNEDGDVWFIQRDFVKYRHIEISSDQNKGLYLAYIDFGNDKFDIVLCDKVVF